MLLDKHCKDEYMMSRQL